LPYANEADLPPSLQPFIACEGAQPLPPPERNIYDLPSSVRRQVRGLELAAAEKEWAEEQASEPLREDVAAALRAKHDLSIGKALAQAKYNQDAIDNAYVISAAPEPQKFFVKRGAIYTSAEKVQKLKPSENVSILHLQKAFTDFIHLRQPASESCLQRTILNHSKTLSTRLAGAMARWAPEVSEKRRSSMRI
jgi:hypothetical protein